MSIMLVYVLILLIGGYGYLQEKYNMLKQIYLYRVIRSKYKMKKRVLSILLASAVLMISGCGRDTIPDRETSSGNKESVTSSSESNIEYESMPLYHQD